MAMGGSNTRNSPFGKGQVLDHPVLWQQIHDPFDIKWKHFQNNQNLSLTKTKGKKIPNNLKTNGQNTMSVLTYHSDAQVGH